MPKTETEIESEGRRRLTAHVTPPATVTEIAHALDVSPAAVSQWIAGATAPSRANAAALETLTGIPASAWTADDVVKREGKKRAKAKRESRS